jgi:hypothetical protein
VTGKTPDEVSLIVPGSPTGSDGMKWLEKARSILHGYQGLPLPDPDRLDIGGVPDTALLIRAIDEAMPRTAVVHLVEPRSITLLPFLAARSIATRRSVGEYFLSIEDGAVAELARLASTCAPDEVCAHLFVEEGNDTLLEAFGRDRGEDVVWLSPRLSRARLRRFLEVISGARPAPMAAPPLRLVRHNSPQVALP